MSPTTRKHGVVMAPEAFRARTETQWFYVNIMYGGRVLGLMVETAVEDEARREAEEICSWFHELATVVDVKKVVIQ